METFSELLALCVGNSLLPVNSPHKGQWCRTLMFSLIWASTNDRINNRDAGDMKRHHAHYDINEMCLHHNTLFRADSRLVPSQWGMVLLCNTISHWLGASLESVLLFQEHQANSTAAGLLMPWLLISPGHQQLWYWLCRINRSVSSMRNNFTYLCHFPAEKSLKIHNISRLIPGLRPANEGHRYFVMTSLIGWAQA